MTIKIYHTLRATKQISKTYIQKKLEQFAPIYCLQFKDKDISNVQFCKQDMRGALSISVGSSDGCISNQIFFTNQNELMAFVEGFILGFSLNKEYVRNLNKGN